MNRKENIDRVLKLAAILLILLGIVTILMGVRQITTKIDYETEQVYMTTSLNLAFGLLKVLAGLSLWKYDVKGYFMGIMLMSVHLASQVMGLIKGDRLVYKSYVIVCIIIIILLFLGINKFRDDINL